MKIGMSKNEVIEYIRKKEESSVYLDNALKKFPKELDAFIKKLVDTDISVKNKNTTDLEGYRKELQVFVLELVIQRLRQLNCFGTPDKKYVEKVFNGTLADIS